MKDGLDRWIDGVGGRSRCDCESDCDFLARFGSVRYDTRMAAAAARASSSLGPRQCGTDSRKKKFAQKKGVRDETTRLHRNIVRSGTDIRRGYAKTSKEKKLKVMQAASYCHSCCRYLAGISAIFRASGGCSMLHRPHAKPEKHAHIDIGMLQHPYYFAQALLVQRGTCTTRCLHDKPDVRLSCPHSAKY